VSPGGRYRQEALARRAAGAIVGGNPKALTGHAHGA
jgi:hypothetical protein